MFKTAFALPALLVCLSQAGAQSVVHRPVISRITEKGFLPVIETRFTQANGLPVNGLSAVEAGFDGYLYAATYGGVVRFNGYQFSPLDYVNGPDLTGARVAGLTQLSDSSFVIQIESSETFLWKNGRVKRVAFQKQSDLNGLRLQHVTTKHRAGFVFDKRRIARLDFETAADLSPLLEFSDDSLIFVAAQTETRWWVETGRDLLVVENSRVVHRLSKQTLPFRIPYPAELVVLDNGGVLYHGPGGCLLLDRTARLVSHLKFTGPMRTDAVRVVRPRSDELFELLTYRGSRLLWSVSKGVLSHTAPAQQLGSLDFGNLPETWLDKRLDIGQNGVLLNSEPLYFPDRNNMVADVLVDGLNQLWIATAGDGLIRFQENPFQGLGKRNGLPGENIYSVIRYDDNALAAASFDGGVMLIRQGSVSSWRMPFPLQAARAVYKTVNGTLYTGYNRHGLQWLDQEMKWSGIDASISMFSRSERFAEAFFEEPGDRLWVGSRETLLKRNGPSGDFLPVLRPDGTPLPLAHGFSVAPDSSLIILTGGNGVWRFTDHTGLRPLLSNSIPLDATRDIHFQSEASWWFASETHGLVRVAWISADSAKIDVLDKSAGLPDNAVHRIIPDRYGFWWLNTNQGIIRVEEAELNAFLDEGGPTPYFELFQENQGLASREGNGGANSAGFKDRDGTIWFPNQKGLVHFDPAYFRNRNSAGPARLIPVALESAVNRYSLRTASAGLVQSDERDLILTFDAIFLGATKPASFEYRLNTGAWLPLGDQRFLSLSGLSHGLQTVEIRQQLAGNSITPLRVTFSIAPFFYETSVFYGLLALGIAGLVVLTFVATRKVAQRRQKFLEDLVDKRTEEVRAQAEQLRELNQHKSDMVLGLTHELRTPLALIQGPLELLQQPSIRLDNATSALQIALARRNTSHLQKLVNQLLQLARLDDQAHPLKQVPVNVDLRLERFVERLKNQLLHSSKTVQLEIRQPIGTVITDPDLLELSVSNLAANALKYAGDSLLVRIILDREPGFFLISVHNGGPVIPEADQKHIFDLFYRGKNSGRQSGSGVGLTIVKRLVEKLEGRITLRSTSESGTVFTIHLPLTATDAPDLLAGDAMEPDVQFDLPEENPEMASGSGAKPAILLVEDNADLRTLLAVALQHDYDMLFAPNGAEGLTVFAGRSVDLIISDVMMPEMDGFEFAAQVRAMDKGASVPFLFLSANDRPDALARGLALGADAYLTKPVSLDLLKAHVWALLHRRNAFFSSAPGGSTPPVPALVTRVDQLIALHMSNTELSVESLATALHMSRASFYRAWEKTGEAPVNERITRARLNFVLDMVRQNNFTFAQAAHACGFSDSAGFSRSFRRIYGVTPTEYLKNPRIEN